MMKKLIKYGFVLLGIGVILLMITIARGGMRTVQFDGVLPKIVKNKQNITKSKRVNDFSSVKIDVQDVDVNVIAGKKYAVKYTGEKADQPKIKVSNKVLKITDGSKREKNYAFFGFYLNDSQRKNSLTITVPKKKTLTNLQISAQGENIKLQQINVESLLLQSEDADININNTKVAINQKIKTEDGDISIRNTAIVAGIIALDDGDATISNATLTDVRLKNQDGDLAINKTVLNGGLSRSSDGDMTFRSVKITNGYQAITEDGDVTATKLQAAGYKTRSTDGDNRLYTKKSSTGRLLKLNSEQNNIFSATTTDGDISIR